MTRPERKTTDISLDGLRVGTRRRTVPHRFVLDAVAEVDPTTRSMFGSLAIYVGDQIVLLLRDRPEDTEANGVWVATMVEHHQSLRSEFPHMRPLRIRGKDIKDWQVLSVDAPDFEESALRACELVVRRDPRIGKVPKNKGAASTRRFASDY